MRFNCAFLSAAKALELGLFAVLLLCEFFTGCDNSCVSVTVNPGGGIISGTGSTCTVPKLTGNVRVSLNSSLAPDTASVRPGVQHVFVSIRGVEALPAAVTGEAPPEWQELAPELEARPAQVDLLAPAADSCGSSLFGEAAIPQGVYNQVRLRLVPNQLQPNEPVPEENACGRAGFNCIVAADDTVRPVAWDDPPGLRVPVERIEGGFFRVLPGGNIRLAIEFNPRSSIAISAGDAVRLFPTFSVSQQSPCEIADQ